MKIVDKPKGDLVKVQYELEKEIVDCIAAMEAHTKMSATTLVGTALKRYISQHKDYLPEDYSKKSNG